MLLGRVEFDNAIIEKYDDYAKLIIPNRKNKEIHLIIRHIDIPRIREKLKKIKIKWLYTFKAGKHKIQYMRLDGVNSSSDYSIFSLIYGDDARHRLDKPVSLNPLTFDIRDICDMLDKSIATEVYNII